MAKIEVETVRKAGKTLRRLNLIKFFYWNRNKAAYWKSDLDACRFAGITNAQISKWKQTGVLHGRRSSLEKLKFLASYEGDAIHLPILLKALEAKHAGRKK